MGGRAGTRKQRTQCRVKEKSRRGGASITPRIRVGGKGVQKKKKDKWDGIQWGLSETVRKEMSGKKHKKKSQKRGKSQNVDAFGEVQQRQREGKDNRRKGPKQQLARQAERRGEKTKKFAISR